MIVLGKGDRCRLVNKRELCIHGIEPLINREVILYEWSPSGGWYFHCVTDPESTRWWAPDMCFQLEQQERKKADEMKQGDKAILINHEQLLKCGMVKCEGKTVTLLYPDRDIPNRWWVIVEDPPREWLPTTNYWVFTECIQIVGRDPRENLWIAGDQAVLVDPATLRDVSMGSQLDKTVTLKRKMTQSEKENRSYAKRYLHEDVWWIKVHWGEGRPEYYVPARCLSKPQQQQSTSSRLVEPWMCDKPKTQTQKEQDSMTMYQVAIVLKPSVIAQQAGAVDKIIVQPTTVMATNDQAAIAQVSAANADTLLALKDDIASITVCSKRFADC